MATPLSRSVALLIPLLITDAPSRCWDSADPSGTSELVGLWEAKRRFGPDVRGPLVLQRVEGQWRAEVAGRFASAQVQGDTMSFELAEGRGAFRGRFTAGGGLIEGHWIQPATVENGTRYASPVVLTPTAGGLWQGEIHPLDDALTFYLKIEPRPDGSTGAFIRNPERNLGRFIRVDHIERDGDAVRLLSRDSPGVPAQVLATGTYREGLLTIAFPSRGGTYDFQRLSPESASDFYPRGRPSMPYRYTPPRPASDGWPTGTLEDVGLSRDSIQRFIQMIIDTRMDSVSVPEIHGVLVARHGRLVLEEYFHGEHRDKPHDTRSASKSLTSGLIGAAIQSVVPLSSSSPVYRIMNRGRLPSELEPRKRALTLEHLLTMSSGLDCDDRDPQSPGNEDVMAEQTEEPDWYRYILDLRSIRDPGQMAVYCSINPHLAGGVLAGAAGRQLPELFHELLAQPLGIHRYYLNLTPTGDVYMGGGARLLPRDFMKLGQLLLNGGTWQGKRILSPDWSRRSTAPLYDLRKLKYGYLWWVIEYPYRGRTVRAFFAGGNGGQVVMGVPELDLVVAIYGGNYSDPILFIPQQQYVPHYILPAVK
jgi:CubicO group peptidase (beta-lactamase class C family)